MRRGIKLGLVIVALVAGYLAPDLLQLKKKMEFVQSDMVYRLADCHLVERRCQVEGYEFQLISGRFTVMERTSFQLRYSGEPVKSEVWITSDDNQFGTLLSQDLPRTLAYKEVLLPYCGNPIMHIIVIDKNKKVGLLIRGLI